MKKSKLAGVYIFYVFLILPFERVSINQPKKKRSENGQEYISQPIVKVTQIKVGTISSYMSIIVLF